MKKHLFLGTGMVGALTALTLCSAPTASAASVPVDSKIKVTVTGYSQPGTMHITYKGVPSGYEFAGAFYDNLTEPNNNSTGISYFGLGQNQVPDWSSYQDLPSLTYFLPMADEDSKAKIILMFANGSGNVILGESAVFKTGMLG